MPTLPHKPTDKSLSIFEAAQLLGISTKTLRRWEAKSILIPAKTQGGHRRYSLRDVQYLKTKANNKGRHRKPSIVITQAPTSFQEELPSLYRQLHVDQKKALRTFSRAFIILGIVVAFFKLGIPQYTTKFAGSLIAPQVESLLPASLQGYFQTDDQKERVAEVTSKQGAVLAKSISLSEVKFDVNVESIFGADATFEENIAANGGNITTTETVFNLLNTGASTINFGGEATTVSIAAQTGTTTVNNSFNVDGTVNDIAGTLNLSGNTLTSTLDLTINPTGGGVSIGTGTANSIDLAGGDFFVSGDLEVDGTSYIPTLVIGGDSFTDLTGTGLQVSGGTLSATLGTSIESSEIADDTIKEVDLNISNTATAGYVLGYDSATTGFTWVDLASVGGWTDGGTNIHPTTVTDSVTIGGTTELAKFGVNGDTDEVQLLVQAFSTQTSDLVVFENSDGDDLFVVDGLGNLEVAGTTLTASSLATITTAANLAISGDTTFTGGGVTLGQDGTDGVLTLYNDAAVGGDWNVVFQPSTLQTISTTYTLPINAGTDNYVLTTNGTGTLAWESVIGAGGMSSFTLRSDAGGTDQTISEADILIIAGGTNGVDTITSNTDTITLNLDYTEISDATFGTGAGFTWRFDSTANDDPQLTFGSDSITFDSTTNTFSGGNIDVEGYGAIGNGSNLSPDTGLIIDYDRIYVAVGQQLGVYGNVTGAANTNVYGINLDPDSITVPAGTTSLVASLYVDEPNITATGTLTSAASIYVAGAPTEGVTNNYALWIDAGAVRFDNTLTLGADASDGQLVIYNDLVAGDHTITINPSASQEAADITFTLPINDGGSNQVLASDGSGVLSWIDVSAGAGNLWTEGVSATYLTNQTEDLALGGTDSTANFYFDEGASAFTINPYGAAVGNTGEIRFSELAANGTNYTGFKAPDTIADSPGNVIYTLPTGDAASANMVLSSNALGQLSWINVSAGAGNLWIDGGAYVYPTSAEHLGNNTSDGANKIAGIYIADNGSLTLGTTNDFSLTYDAATDNRLELTASNQEFAIALGNQDVLIAGSAEGTSALTVSAGDVVITDGDLTLSGGETSLATNSTINASKALTVSHTGTIAGTGYGLYSTVTGASTTNIAGFFSATVGTTNYGLVSEGADADLAGGTGAGGNLLLMSTTNASKGQIQFGSASYYITSIGEIVAAATNTINGININSGAVSGVNDLAIVLGAANDVTIDAAATDNTTATGVIDLNVDTVTTGNIGLNIDHIIRDSAGITAYGARINETIDADAAESSTGYGLYIAGANNDASSTLTALYVDAGTGAGTEYAASFMNGNVGIGTTAPSHLLGVNTTAGTRAISVYHNASTGNYAAIGFQYSSTNTATGSEIRGYNARGGNDADIGIAVMDSAGTMQERLRLLGLNGNVGIGTTAPDARLEINHATGDNLRLTYDDANGSATNYTDLSLSATGGLTLTGSAATLADSATAEKTFLTLTPGTITLTGPTTVTSLMETSVLTGATIAASQATIANKATTLSLTAPIDGDNISIMNTSALRIRDVTGGTGYLEDQYGIYIENLTSASNMDIGIYLNGADDYSIYSLSGSTAFYFSDSSDAFGIVGLANTSTNGVLGLTVETGYNANKGLDISHTITDSLGVTAYGAKITETINDDVGHSSTAYGLHITGANDDASSTLTALYVDAGTGIGTEYAGVFTNGNVGIGDTSPASKLEVGDGTDSIQFGDTGDITFVDADGAATITGPAGGSLTVAAGASQDLALTAADDITFDDLQLATALNLTLADTAINASLTQGIVDAINDLYDMGTSGGGSAIWSKTGAIIYPTAATDDLAIGGSTTAAPFYFDESAELLTLINTTAGNSLVINDEASDTTPFVIDEAGSLGIGVSDPGAKLDILALSADNEKAINLSISADTDLDDLYGVYTTVNDGTGTSNETRNAYGFYADVTANALSATSAAADRPQANGFYTKVTQTTDGSSASIRSYATSLTNDFYLSSNYGTTYGINNSIQSAAGNNLTYWGTSSYSQPIAATDSSFYGAYNGFISAGTGNTLYGIENFMFSMANTNTLYGVKNDLGLTGANTQTSYGIATDLHSTAAGHTSYGEYIASDTTSTAGTQYGIYINVNEPSTTNWSIYSAAGESLFIAGTTTETPISIKAAAAQTANLTEWQNSSGTPFLSVDAIGAISQTYTPAGTTGTANGVSLAPTFGVDATDQTLSGINIAANTNSNTDAGDTLYGVNLANITGTSATETAIVIGTGWDTGVSVASGGITIAAGALAVNSDSVTSDGTLTVDSSGTVQLGTDDDFLPQLGAGSADLGASGTAWDNLYVTALTVNGTADPYVDETGDTMTGALAIAPTATGTFLDFVLETEWTTGTLMNADFAGATTQSGDMTGLSLNLNTNLTAAADSDVTGINVQTPALTASGANTTTYNAYNISSAGALDTADASATVINWSGLKIAMPNIDTGDAADTVTAYGLNIAAGAVTNGAGTENMTPINLTRAASGQWIAFNDGTDSWGLFNYAGSPENNIAANTGALAMDTTNGTLYVKTDDTDATGWTNLATGTTNPWTDAGAYLYPTDAETLGNSASAGANKIAGIYLTDNGPLTLGSDNDWSVLYDETTDDRLELATAGTSGLLISSAVVSGTGAAVNFDSLTTGTGIGVSLDALTTGTGFLVESAGSQTLSGDLFKIGIGANVVATGNLFNVVDNTTSLFAVKEAKITSALPHEFTAAGDVTLAYDLVFTNQTAGFVKSYGPLTVESGESFESQNLTLKTYNSGKVIADTRSMGVGTSTGKGLFEVDASTTTTFGKALAIFNHDETQDLLTASASGTTKFAIASDGKVYIGDNTTLATSTALCWASATRNGATVYQVGDCTGSPADLAEWYPAKSDSTLEPGDIVAIGDPLVSGTAQAFEVTTATASAQSKMLGIVSTNAYETMGEDVLEWAQKAIQVGLVGRVPVKIASDSEPIAAGDFLTISDTEAGRAKKSTGNEYTVGKALEAWTPGSGVDRINVFINLSTNLNTAFADGALDNSDISLIDSLSATDSATLTSLTTTNLNVLGDTTLGDTVITGTLSVGTLSFDSVNQSIDAIGALKIQPLALGNIEFLGGLVKFDTTGNIELTQGVILGNSNFRDSQTISTGASFVRVTRTWDSAPTSVTVTPDYNTRVWITDKDNTGFTINVDTAPLSDQKLDWVAIW